MSEYRHHVSGFFARREDAERALAELVEQGLPRERLNLMAANVSLFIASPLIAPLAMLGWGASVGGLLGAAAGAGSREGGFSDLVRDAISSGQVVLVARTRTVEETTTARNVIQAAAACEYKDVSTV